MVLAMRDGSLSMAHRGCLAFFMQSGAQEQIMMAHRCKRVRQRISRIERECAFQKHQRLCRTLRHPGIDVGLSPQDKIIGIEAFRPHAFDALDFGPTQAPPPPPHDPKRDLVLQREKFFARTGVSFRPPIASPLGFYHLPGGGTTIAAPSPACSTPRESLCPARTSGHSLKDPAQGCDLDRQIAVLDRKSRPRRLDQCALGNRLSRPLQKQPKQRNRALAQHGRFVTAKEYFGLRVEAERAESVDRRHWLSG